MEVMYTVKKYFNTQFYIFMKFSELGMIFTNFEFLSFIQLESKVKFIFGF